MASASTETIRGRQRAPEISLTDFVDFSIRQGSSQLAKVKEIKYRPGYEPAFDFWKAVRDAIREYHEQGHTDRRNLDRLLRTGVGDTPVLRTARHVEAITAYKTFLGRKRIEFFAPGTREWHHRELVVRVNPELGLRMNGQERLVKLYFKKEEPSKRNLEVVLQMMRVTYGSEWVPAVLDVSRNKLHVASNLSPDAQLLLEAEADAFLRLWNGVQRRGEERPLKRSEEA